MKLFRTIKSLFVFTASALVVLLVASYLQIIQFHYPRDVENNPLLSPVKVQSVRGTRLHLEDGRIYQIDTLDEPLDKLIEESGFLVDVEVDAATLDSRLYAKRRRWICGTPWRTGILHIPLIPDDLPTNHRQLIGIATAVSNDSKEGK
jgi:hypothetical protein